MATKKASASNATNRARATNGKPAARRKQQADPYRPRNFTPTRQKAFLKALAGTGSIVRAAQAAGVHRSTVHRAAERDKVLGEQIELARQQGEALLLEACWARAVDGVKREVRVNGKVVGHDVTYSDRLLELLLKAHFPEQFRERIEHSLPSGVGFGVFKLPDKAPSMKAWMQEAGGENADGSD